MHAPLPTQGHESITLPYSEHIQWIVDGTHLTAPEGESIVHPVPRSNWPARVKVIAEPLSGAVIEGENQWTFDFEEPSEDHVLPAVIEVTATKPTHTDPEGAKNDTFTIPEIEGVQYFLPVCQGELRPEVHSKSV